MAQYAELKGKVALVTGAGRRKGLGEAIARRLASEGCKVIVTDIGHAKGKEMPESAVGSQSEMEHVAADIHAAATAAGNGGACSALALDVLEESQVKEVIATTVARHSSLDILVNNAGIGYLMKPIVEMSIEEWDAVLGVNLRGAFLCTKYAAMQMIKQNGGGRAGGADACHGDRNGQVRYYRQCHLPKPRHHRIGCMAERIFFRGTRADNGAVHECDEVAHSVGTSGITDGYRGGVCVVV